MRQRKSGSNKEDVRTETSQATDFTIDDLFAEIEGMGVILPKMQENDITAQMMMERYGLTDEGARKRMRRIAEHSPKEWMILTANKPETNHPILILRRVQVV